MTFSVWIVGKSLVLFQFMRDKKCRSSSILEKMKFCLKKKLMLHTIPGFPAMNLFQIEYLSQPVWVISMGCANYVMGSAGFANYQRVSIEMINLAPSLRHFIILMFNLKIILLLINSWNLSIHASSFDFHSANSI